MRTFAFSRYALTTSIAAAVLAGCAIPHLSDTRPPTEYSGFETAATFDAIARTMPAGDTGRRIGQQRARSGLNPPHQMVVVIGQPDGAVVEMDCVAAETGDIGSIRATTRFARGSSRVTIPSLWSIVHIAPPPAPIK